LTGDLKWLASVPSSEDAIMSDSSSRARFDPVATKRWAERLARFHSGSQNVAAFCAAEGVSESNFYAWRRRLARPGSPAVIDAPAVVPLRITPSPATPIELALPSGAVVRFPADTRPELLVVVLRGLEGRPC
jgi:transposase